MGRETMEEVRHKNQRFLEKGGKGGKTTGARVWIRSVTPATSSATWPGTVQRRERAATKEAASMTVTATSAGDLAAEAKSRSVTTVESTGISRESAMSHPREARARAVENLASDVSRSDTSHVSAPRL